MGGQPAIDLFLERARRSISPRVTPAGLAAAVSAGALVVDTRPVEQRSADGEMPGAVAIDRNVLEWRLDPSSPHRCDLAVAGRPVILVCNEGFSSSLAAATLRELGVDATDLDGGYQGWVAWQRRDPRTATRRTAAAADPGRRPPWS